MIEIYVNDIPNEYKYAKADIGRKPWLKYFLKFCMMKLNLTFFVTFCYYEVDL